MAHPPVAEVHADATDGFRGEVRAAARAFKASWTGLARVLTRVRDEALWRGWGFSSFEAYCAQEIHIRKATALKLTRSWTFLHRHEREWGESPPERARPAPAFEVVEVLADAEERGQLSAAEYRSIRDSIWNPERPVAELKREIADRFPRPAPEPPPDGVQLRRLAAAVRKLAADLAACRKVPKAVSERASALADDVEELASAARRG